MKPSLTPSLTLVWAHFHLHLRRWAALCEASPLKMGQMCFHMDMAPVLWNCPSASSM